MRDGYAASERIHFFGQFFGLTVNGNMYVAIYTRHVDMWCAHVLWRWNQLAYNYRPAWFKRQPEVENLDSNNQISKRFELQWLCGAVAAFEVVEG